MIDPQKNDVMARVGELAQSRVYQLSDGGAVLAAGVRLVYDTITSSVTLNQALRITRGKGSVVLLGLVGLPEKVDWTPIWMKELKVLGSLTYGAEVVRGKRANTFARAVELLTKRRADLRPIKPRKYPLHQYREALIEASSKSSSGAVKVSFAL